MTDGLKEELNNVIHVNADWPSLNKAGGLRKTTHSWAHLAVATCMNAGLVTHVLDSVRTLPHIV